MPVGVLFRPDHLLQVLRPFKIRGGHTACIGEQIRNNRNAAILEKAICRRSNREVGPLDQQLGPYARRIAGRQYSIDPAEHQHIAIAFEDL